MKSPQFCSSLKNHSSYSRLFTFCCNFRISLSIYTKITLKYWLGLLWSLRKCGEKEDIENTESTNQSVQFSLVTQHAQLFVTPWTAARKAPLSITNSQSLLKLTSLESVMPSNHPILCHPLLLLPSIFPSIRIFSNELVLLQSIRVSASASVLPVNTQDWSPLGWTGWVCLQFKGLSRVFSNTTVQKHQFFSAQLSL